MFWVRIRKGWALPAFRCMRPDEGRPRRPLPLPRGGRLPFRYLALLLTLPFSQLRRWLLLMRPLGPLGGRRSYLLPPPRNPPPPKPPPPKLPPPQPPPPPRLPQPRALDVRDCQPLPLPPPNPLKAVEPRPLPPCPQP